MSLADANWNTNEEKQRFQRTKHIKSGSKAEKIRAARKAEMHELEKDRYDRLSKENWRETITEHVRTDGEGIFVTYAPAETDARILAHLIWRVTGEKTMVHMHGVGEACIEAVYSNEKGVGTQNGTSSGVERLQAGCEWIGPKR